MSPDKNSGISAGVGGRVTPSSSHVRRYGMKIKSSLTSAFGFFPKLIKNQYLKKHLNRFVINHSSRLTKPRPNSYSLWRPLNGKTSAYLSWPSVSDRRYFSRHLAPDEKFDSRLKPDLTDLAALSSRGGDFKAGKSNLLFMYFAQWFTDGVFGSKYQMPHMSKGSQHVDLSQIYGLNESDTHCLRSFKNGKLKTEIAPNGEVVPPYLFTLVSDGSCKMKPEFAPISYLCGKDNPSSNIDDSVLIRQLKLTLGLEHSISLPDDLLLNLHATGLERGNATIGNLLVSTLFLREHNNICDALKDEPSLKGDEERIFQTARIINIVVLIKLTIEQYISHISGHDFLALDNHGVETKKWYREPWVSAEFNLVYRWHGLVPDEVNVGNEPLDPRKSAALGIIPLSEIIEAAQLQAAGAIQFGNVPSFLLGAEKRMIEHGREWRLKPYNEYRIAFGLKPLKSFEELTDDPHLARELERLYKHIDDLEFTVGCYAEKRHRRSSLGRLQANMVGYDAFTQLYTNPLLTKDHLTSRHLTKTGKAWIDGTTSFDQFVKRNVSDISMELSFDAP